MNFFRRLFGRSRSENQERVEQNESAQPQVNEQANSVRRQMLPETRNITVRSAKGNGETFEVKGLNSSGEVQDTIGEDIGKYPSYGKMLAALDTLNAILTLQQDIPASASATMVEKLVDAYSVTIDAMNDYITEMRRFAWTPSGRAKRAARRACIRELLTFVEADKARIERDAAEGRTQGRTPREIVSQARTEQLQDNDFTGIIKGGAINQVYRYQQGYFKPSNGGELSSNEKQYANDIGLKYQDTNGQAIDPHMNEREVASSRLDKLLGGGVIGGAKKAQISQQSALRGQTFHDNDRDMDRTFNAEAGKSGVLMDEAKGMAFGEYNWDFLGVERKDMGDLIYDDRDDKTIGEKLKDKNLKKMHVQAIDHAASIQTGKKMYMPMGTGVTLNAQDGKLQRDMNTLFLLDTLSMQTDRHSGNFMIQGDENGYKGLTGIDNDISFGEKNEKFGKKMTNYSGLPKEMLVDRKLANRIRAVTESELTLVFSDLLTQGEIEALWERFQMLSKYLDNMEEKGLLVSDWNEETAEKQVLMQKGVGSEGKDYYTRHILALNTGAALKNI